MTQPQRADQFMKSELQQYLNWTNAFIPLHCLAEMLSASYIIETESAEIIHFNTTSIP